MKIKTVEVNGKTYAEVQDGKPVFVGDDGKDVAVDVPATAGTISRLNAEAKGHREAKERAEAALKAFEGIADPAAALKALATIKNLDDKKLVDAGEVEKVKAEAIKAVEEKYKPTVEKSDKLERELYAERVGGQFARSKFIADKVAVPADMVQATFGRYFKDEGGKAVAYGPDGNKVYSRSKPGEPADFDEALEILVGAYPHRDSILKGTGGGSGARGGAGGAGNGAKTITRAEFQKMDPAAQMKAIRQDGMTVVDG